MLEETPEEREIFSAMEQSSVRKEIIRTTREEKISKPGVYEKSVAMPNYLHLMEELSVARMLIRELGDRLAKLEKPWVGLTDKDRYEFAAAQYGWEDLLIAAEKRLKEKNF